MSRRKQARPSRHLDCDEDGKFVPPLENGEAEKSGGSGGSGSEEDSGEQDLIKSEHEKKFQRKKEKGADRGGNPNEINNSLTDEDEDKPTEDANNNESKSREGSVEKEESNSTTQEDIERETLTAAIQNIMGNFPTINWPAGAPGLSGQTNITLEALQNTKVAVAQFAANALQATSSENGANPSLQDLAVLQSTLFTLQQQQIIQLQLIQQLQHQLTVSNSAPNSVQGDSAPNSPGSPSAPTSSTPPPLGVEIKFQGSTVNKASEVPSTSKAPTNLVGTAASNAMSSLSLLRANQSGGDGGLGLSPHFASLLNCGNQDPNMPLSPGLANHNTNFSSSILSPDGPDEPNSLEMLQRRAQEVLDSASQGLLASSLGDDPNYRKKAGLGPYEKGKEPFFRHRCRFCGKVFGSDSALQIHIRSHTGERPFKCNVCGSRFTTKGNLKVHFQRHTSKFPHVKMNPHPVPEHLDHFHPPLLSSGQTTPEHSPTGLGPTPQIPPHGPPPPPFTSSFHPFNPLFRFTEISPRPPGPPPQHLNHKEIAAAQGPQDLTKPKSNKEEYRREASESPERKYLHHHEMERMIKREKDDDDDLSDDDKMEMTKEEEEEEERLITEENERMEFEEMKAAAKAANFRGGLNIPHMRIPRGEGSSGLDSDGEGDRDEEREEYNDDEFRDEDSFNEEFSQDQPENLSSKSLPLMYPIPLLSRPDRPSSASMMRSLSGSPNKTTDKEIDPAKDPAIYTNLLPRPGSNDNAWESLIEVTKTSETTKLQQLVDNIEHKLTDPNQCIICHRVLSCKSALQMHYRTHTGERPFKCKICGRAFTTKGNLKTHMGVHRAKPPLRVLHQCPVCHKRFTNSLVLQQHIRLHTGEPTDLTPDQIRAAEVKDPFPSFLPSHSFPYGSPVPPHFLPPGAASLLQMKPPSSGGSEREESFMREGLKLKKEDEDSNDEGSLSDSEDRQEMIRTPQESPKVSSFSTSLAALENQVRTITTFANQSGGVRTFPGQLPEDLTSKRPEQPRQEQKENGLMKSPESPSGHSDDCQDSDVSSENWKNNMSEGEQHGQSFRSSPYSRLTPPTPNNGQTTPPNFGGALDLTPRAAAGGLFSPFLPGGTHVPHPLVHNPLMTSSALTSLANSVLTSTAFSPVLGVGPPHGRPRGNTTCNICLKTFACHSALEIHYRSHTKERPFKCNVCDRGFSTKGNMKQHMLTHKIRDMPGNVFDSKSSNGQQSDGDSNISNSTATGKSEDLRSMCTSPCPSEKSGQKRPPSENSLPPPPKKSAPAGLPEGGGGGGGKGDGQTAAMDPVGGSNSSSKHVCHVCTKSFSSSSSVHIHMRTHTGDKPFKCNVCQKAFTTKGNLKVHMGTHMWTNGASRRGRRMSLELPLGLQFPPPHLQPPHPGTIKDHNADVLARRPDLFYPYVPASAPHFLNGSPKFCEYPIFRNSVLSGGINVPQYGKLRPGAPDYSKLKESSGDVKVPLSPSLPPSPSNEDKDMDEFETSANSNQLPAITA